MAPSKSELLLASERDDLFARTPWPKPFEFNHEVVRVFDDMVSRSVPLYTEVLLAAAKWTQRFYQSGTSIIDVGCSTGTFLALIGRALEEPATLIGIDNSEPMLAKAAEKLSSLQDHHQIDLRCQDAALTDFTNSSVVVMNYTLQFLPMSERQRVLDEVYSGMVPGGLLFVSEKVRADCAPFQEAITYDYESFKAQNGYAETEIERKKEALENVLVPLTMAEQQRMFTDAGFVQVEILMKLHHFTTFVIRK